MEIGGKGLADVNLTIPQNTSLTFDVVHTDDEGNVIDHSQSTLHMAIQTKDKKVTYVMDSCCTADSEKIRVSIPASQSEMIPLGKHNWDLLVTTELGEQIRVLYGNATVIDTYALDEE